MSEINEISIIELMERPNCGCYATVTRKVRLASTKPLGIDFEPILNRLCIVEKQRNSFCFAILASM